MLMRSYLLSISSATEQAVAVDHTTSSIHLLKMKLTHYDMLQATYHSLDKRNYNIGLSSEHIWVRQRATWSSYTKEWIKSQGVV